MVRNLIRMPDGQEVFSGGPGSAVMACSLTRSVNTGTELTPGAVCAAMAEITLLDAGDLRLSAGDTLTLYAVDEQGKRHQTGIFIARKPERSGALLRLTAYDRVVLLDRDLTGWLAGLDRWPYSLQELAQLVCAQCGVTLADRALPNGDFPVEKFAADGVTGRQLMGWIGQACCRFCRATPEGELEFAWYAPAPLEVGTTALYDAEIGVIGGDLTLRAEGARTQYRDGQLLVECPQLRLTHDGQGNVTLDLNRTLLRQYYFQGGLTLQDYITAPIEKVQLRQSQSDIGTLWPDSEAPVNTLIITGNPLLAATDARTLQPVAQTLYEQLKDTVYTPCTLKLPTTLQLDAGSILTVTDPEGRASTVYVMELRRDARGDTLVCSGSPARQTTAAANDQSYRALSGKVLSLRTDVDGLQAENSNNAGKFSRLELDIEGIRGQVSAQSAETEGIREQLTTLEQTAGALKLSVESMQTDGTSKIRTAMGYTFDDNGLQIAREGQQMKNLLDNTGMYVTRSGQTVLQANDKGVVAVDVTVRNYLIMGTHARFEDYTAGRTACFWLEG